MCDFENHKLRQENLNKLKNFERDNISFDILSRAAFAINSSKTQPEMTSNNGIIYCKYPTFELHIKETEFLFHFNSNREKSFPADSREVIDQIRMYTA